MPSDATKMENWPYLTEQNRVNGEPMIVSMIIHAMLIAKGEEPFPGCTDGLREVFKVLYAERYGIWLDGDITSTLEAEAKEAALCSFVGSTS